MGFVMRVSRRGRTHEKLPDQQKSLLLLLAQEEDWKEGGSEGSKRHRKDCPHFREGSSPMSDIERRMDP